VALVRLAAAAVVALAVTAGVGGAASHADTVTLSFRTYLNQQRTLVMVWYGQVSSGAGGEDIEILARECLTPGYRQMLATKTGPGGGYEVENPPATPPPSFTYVEIHSGMTFRARWRNELSAPFTWRTPLVPEVIKLSARRWKLRVNPRPVYMNLAGKFVELQRLRSGRWVRYQRARLVRKPNFEYGGATNHIAIFEAPRGLTLRAVLPAKSVAPCFKGGPSAQWRS
jgi:hypothetical protein